MISQATVVAVGVTSNGDRQVLGVDVGPSEDRAFWTAFLRSLVKRGLNGVRLVISDAHEGLKSIESVRFLATSHPRPSRPANRARASRTIPRSVGRRDEARDTLQQCSGMSIDVEILIRAPMDALWAHTQTPVLRWDLRFSRIDSPPV